MDLVTWKSPVTLVRRYFLTTNCSGFKNNWKRDIIRREKYKRIIEARWGPNEIRNYAEILGSTRLKLFSSVIKLLIERGRIGQELN